MNFRYWENPYARGGDRIYINDAGFLKGSAKAWLGRASNGAAVLQTKNLPAESPHPDDIECEVFLELEATGVVKPGKRPRFDELLDALEQTAPPKPVAGRAKQPRPDNRVKEAAGLDLLTISIPEPVTIAVDHREPAEIADWLEAHPGIEVTRGRALALGDFVINDKIIIERKACNSETGNTDFENSVIESDKRLFYQSEKMKFEEEMLGIVILEGDVYGNSQRMLIQSIDGAISYLTAIQQLSVLCTVSMKHTAYMIAKLATHERSGLGYTPPLRGSKPRTLSSQQSFLIQGLPGVSVEIAENLLRHFGGVPAVLSASKDELAAVPGIGPGRAQKIHAVLCADWQPE